MDENPKLDSTAFDRIHREYGRRLVGNMAGLVRDRDKAEDVAASAFQTAWEKRETFRGNAQPTTWIEAIARNEARSLHRGETRRVDSIDREGLRDLPLSEHLTDDLEKRDDRLRLNCALAQLSGKHRRALTAHFVEGLSVRDIAGREYVPVGTVLSRIHTGKQLLREAWERFSEASGEHKNSIADRSRIVDWGTDR